MINMCKTKLYGILRTCSAPVVRLSYLLPLAGRSLREPQMWGSSWAKIPICPLHTPGAFWPWLGSCWTHVGAGALHFSVWPLCQWMLLWLDVWKQLYTCSCPTSKGQEQVYSCYTNKLDFFFFLSSTPVPIGWSRCPLSSGPPPGGLMPLWDQSYQTWCF